MTLTSSSTTSPVAEIYNQATTPIMSPHSQTAAAPPASPGYFGFQTSTSDLPVSTYGGQHARQNWSPPSSTVRSTAAISPSYIPVDQNPDFAAFRRQSDGLGRAFTLSSFHSFPSQRSSPVTPKVQKEQGTTIPRQRAYTNGSKSPPVRPGPFVFGGDPTIIGRSPKRHLSNDSTNFPSAHRRSSPATDDNSSSSPSDESHPPIFALSSPPQNISLTRAETVPSTNVENLLVSPQHVITLLEADAEEILILDLRVSTQYARSRISGALSLCIPTTLMKRPSFNVTKLAETFKNKDQKIKFENWRSSKYIIVYDAAASQLKDATICINTIKKFESEGFQGTAYIIQGGFADFSRAFPNYIDKSSDPSLSALPGKITMPAADAPLPVLGGCPIPATKTAANPFFGNIRQNMDLIGGVGQMPVNLPAIMSPEAVDAIPNWLGKASEATDNGAQVSDKFLHIEKREQKRMQEALSSEVSYGTPLANAPAAIKIAGIEKGAKNRYNNIWPFEHSRVKLQGVPDNECDYVNANHIQSSMSNKRYIATQGPIPATFADFWNVVWQQDVRVIVMLTAEKEGGQIKAHDYWSARQHGPFRLEQLSTRKATLDPAKIHRHRTRHSRKASAEDKPNIIRNDSKNDDSTSGIGPAPPSSDEPFITVRRLALSHEMFPFEPMREITQLQYSSWPDFGAPAHPSHLLGLVEQCDAVVRALTHAKHADPEPAASRPVLVHCSAGCGRTGTFCTVDSVIDMLKRQRLAQSEPRASGIPAPSPSSAVSPRTFFNNPFFSGPVTPAQDALDGDWRFGHDVDLVEKCVEEFRLQRLSMVQSLRQYVLCYETVLEWLAEEERRENE